MPNREGTLPVLGFRGAKYFHYRGTGSVGNSESSRIVRMAGARFYSAEALPGVGPGVAARKSEK